MKKKNLVVSPYKPTYIEALRQARAKPSSSPEEGRCVSERAARHLRSAAEASGSYGAGQTRETDTDKGHKHTHTRTGQGQIEKEVGGARGGRWGHGKKELGGEGDQKKRP